MRRFAAVLFCLAAAACMRPTTAYPTPDATAIQSEARRQQALYVEAEHARETARAKKRLASQARLARVAAPLLRTAPDLCRDLGQPPQTCTFPYVLSDGDDRDASGETPRVTATPAMMQLARSDDELAFLLAHEAAHNLMRHAEATRRNGMAGAALGLLLDSLAAAGGVNSGGDFTEEAYKEGAAALSPDFESEADYIGLYLAARAGYDPAPIPNFWRRMAAEEGASVFAGKHHPSHPERFLALDLALREIAAKRAAGQPLVPNRRGTVSPTRLTAEPARDPHVRR